MSKCNGWANWETWKTNLELLDGMTGEDLGLSAGMDPYLAGLEVREYALEVSGDWETNSFVSGIVWEFFNQVHWTEIAEHLLRDMKEEEEEESEE
jgi:hypothetical protein